MHVQAAASVRMQFSNASRITAPAESVVSLAKVLPVDFQPMATQPTCFEYKYPNILFDQIILLLNIAKCAKCHWSEFY